MNAVQPANAVPRADSGLIEGLLKGESRALARALTAVENGLESAPAILAAIQPHMGRANVVGVTGAPGAGKSTLISALLGELLARGKRVAVAAIDPSSPISGGAVLGDRVRMGEHGANQKVFIRSFAARGHLGGLTRTTRRIVDVFDAAGFDVIIVETVGAGQSEVDIRLVADTSIVVCPPGLGDEVQAIKAGILEIADVLVVSKGDLPAAERTLGDLQGMLALRRVAVGGWRVPVIRTAAASGEGIAALADSIEQHRKAAGSGSRNRALVSSDPAAARLAGLAARDPFVTGLGIELVDGGAGRAVARLAIRAGHLNFNGTCHGGVVFALADTAFGLAANSHGGSAAGIDAHITYQVAVEAGEVLTATAVEVSRSRKLGVYRVDVARADGRLISVFTGTVYVTDLPGDPALA